jgi:hypothetical protein
MLHNMRRGAGRSLGEVGLGGDALSRLVDEAACRAVLMRYGRAVDWRDLAGLEALFWPDAEVDLGFFKGTGAEAPAFLVENAGRSLRRLHITANSSVSVDGDAAHAESCAITHALSGSALQEAQTHLFIGRYLDRLERRGSEWRIAWRLYLLHSVQTQAYAEPEALGALSKADALGPGHPLFQHL